MKTNKKFVEKAEAVSTVIGVILMVAIVVAVATTVYIFASNMTTKTESNPIVSFNVIDDKLVVSKATKDTLWSDVNVTISDGTNTGYYKGTGQVTSGDKIFINTQCPACTGKITVTVVYTPSNTLLGTYDFN